MWYYIDDFMPFKTRKHKLAAEARRFTIDLQSSAISYNKEVDNGKVTKKIPGKPNESTAENFNYVLGEISRIAILAFILVVIQLVIRLSLGPNPLNFFVK